MVPHPPTDICWYIWTICSYLSLTITSLSLLSLNSFPPSLVNLSHSTTDETAAYEALSSFCLFTGWKPDPFISSSSPPLSSKWSFCWTKCSSTLYWLDSSITRVALQPKYLLPMVLFVSQENGKQCDMMIRWSQICFRKKLNFEIDIRCWFLSLSP